LVRDSEAAHPHTLALDDGALDEGLEGAERMPARKLQQPGLATRGDAEALELQPRLVRVRVRVRVRVTVRVRVRTLELQPRLAQLHGEGQA